MLDIQSIIAFVIFAATTIFFIYRSLNKKKDDCAGGCGCSKK